MLRIAVGLHRNSADDWDSAAIWAQEVEKLGIDSIWSAETWGIDGVTPLARIASSTERIRLGTGILQIGARTCLLYTSPSPRDGLLSRMPSSA